MQNDWEVRPIGEEADGLATIFLILELFALMHSLI